MTKAELINDIAVSTGYDKTTISNIVEAGMASIKKSVAEGENVYLRGFGSFIAKIRRAKVARNISKNISVNVPEHKIAAFKASKEFNEMVR
ncbi:MAG: integration host factor subunit beta [Paludibacteraceae bacterium]|nr:integration host factor subunit beta [Paludibacteraceae bacterium]